MIRENELIKKYEYLDMKTYDIVSNNSIATVNHSLAHVISTLCKKGYYVIDSNSGNSSNSKAIIYENIFKKLIENKLLTDDFSLIKEIIAREDICEIYLTFDKEYNFETLPKDFIKINNSLVFFIPYYDYINKDLENHEIVNKLDKLRNNKIKELKNWSDNLKKQNCYKM